MVEKVVTQYFNMKSTIGKMQAAYKDVKNAAQLLKKYQVAITCHAQSVGMNGVGSVELTIVNYISIQ